MSTPLPAPAKPRLRGWLHAITFPLALLGGLILTAYAPDGRARIGSLGFTMSAALLFGPAAIYHRGTWSARVHGLLKRLDHSNIFVIIAGSIDLSVGSIVALSALMAASASQQLGVWAIIPAAIVGTLGGLLNGLLFA